MTILMILQGLVIHSLVPVHLIIGTVEINLAGYALAGSEEQEENQQDGGSHEWLFMEER